ncbi:MAG: hypothetical protein RR058_06070 [Oscillospiraceae bacterium]
MANMFEKMPKTDGYEMKSRTDTKKKQRKQRNIFISVVAVLIIIIVILLLLRGCQGTETVLLRETAAQAGIMPGMSEAEIADRLNRIVDESKVNIAMNSTPILKDGLLSVAIENIPGNKYSFKVKVVMDDDGTVLFETNLIDPGFYIEELKIKEKLEPGAHDATATFTCYDPKSLKEAGSTGLKIVVLVPGTAEEPKKEGE